MTQNQGVTWTSQPSGAVHDLYGISCTRTTECLADGHFGIAVVTLDGAHWSLLNTPTGNALRAAVFQDLNHAWVGGFGGTILANSALTPGCGTASVTPDQPSPQPAGSTIGLIPSSTGCSSPSYEVWIQYPSGTWYLARPWGAGSFSWITTGWVPGTYIVHVWANQAGDSTSTYEALGALTFVLSGCTGASITPPSVAQAVGSTVNLVASATGCPDPRFEFFALYPNGLWYQLSSGWGGSSLSWNTTGLARGAYTIHAWANQVNASIATYETIGSGTVSLSFCSGAGLGPASDTAPAGGMVVLTATSSGCTSPRFAFYVQYPNGTWYLKQPFMSTGTFNWDTTGLAPGSYLVHGWVSAIGSGHDSIGEDRVTLTGCTAASVTVASSAPAGTVVNMTGAGSAGCPNPQFEYWVQYPDMSWHLDQPWGSSAFAWDTSAGGGLKPGPYTIHAWTNQTGASQATYEAIGSATVTLTGCTAATVTPATGTDKVGTPILLTVAPVTCTGTPVYEFWVQYPDGSWHEGPAFSTSNTWTWPTTGLPKGNYVIHVWVNNQGADTSKYDFIGTATHTLT
jgi:hypothetical protein